MPWPSPGSGDFTLANRLYRNRPALSTGGLGRTGVGAGGNGPQADGRGFIDPLGQARLWRADADAAGAEKRPAVGALEASIGSDSLPWSDAAAELRALYALALENVSAG